MENLFKERIPQAFLIFVMLNWLFESMIKLRCCESLFCALLPFNWGFCWFLLLFWSGLVCFGFLVLLLLLLFYLPPVKQISL